MKKLISVFVAIAIAGGAYAQENTTKTQQELNNSQKQNTHNNYVSKSTADGIIMHNGKMMQVKNGQMTSLDNDMTLKNGTKIASDGSWVKKDGSKWTMKEGQHMDINGNITSPKVNNDKNTYVVPDTTKKRNY